MTTTAPLCTIASCAKSALLTAKITTWEKPGGTVDGLAVTPVTVPPRGLRRSAATCETIPRHANVAKNANTILPHFMILSS